MRISYFRVKIIPKVPSRREFFSSEIGVYGFKKKADFRSEGIIRKNIQKKIVKNSFS
jgi:hypothetical protein